MPKLSKHLREEWAFFLHLETGRHTYNELCRGCVNSCKQSFRAEIIECPRHLSKRATYYAQSSNKERCK